jgi:hypothetical protein
MPHTYEYDVAISYAGPDRAYAEQLARILRDAKLAVFFDLFEEATILGKRLYAFLQDVYENKARYCVVLLSQHYADRIWPRHEIQAAFNRAVREKGDYILPVRLDDAEIHGLPSDLAYLSAKGRSARDIAAVLIQKITPHIHSERAMVQLYTSRTDVFDSLVHEIENERSNIIFLGTATWIGQASHAVLSAFRAASNTPGLRMRFMLPDPETIEARASQELRAPGQLRLEVQSAIAVIREYLPSVELRLVGVLPVYSALCLTETVLFIPYLYTRGPLAGPALAYRRTGPVPHLYEMITDDLERLWSLASPNEPT